MAQNIPKHSTGWCQLVSFFCEINFLGRTSTSQLPVKHFLKGFEPPTGAWTLKKPVLETFVNLGYRAFVFSEPPKKACFQHEDFTQKSLEASLRRLFSSASQRSSSAQMRAEVGAAGRATALSLFGAKVAKPRLKELLSPGREDRDWEFGGMGVEESLIRRHFCWGNYLFMVLLCGFCGSRKGIIS